MIVSSKIHQHALWLIVCCLTPVLLSACGMNAEGMSSSNSGNLFVSDAGGNMIAMFNRADPASNASAGMNMGMRMGMDMNTSMGTMSMTSSATSPESCANSCHHNPAAASGTLAADAMIGGARTTLNGPAGIVVDSARDILYVANANSASILAFDHASMSSGNLAPSRVITSTSLRRPEFLALVDDTLFVTDSGSQALLVLDHVSQANGAVDVSRTIEGDTSNGSKLVSPLGVFVNSNTGIIYVANMTGTSVSILGFARDASGGAPASRVYTTPLKSAGGMSMDIDRNELYVADPSADVVAVFSHIDSSHASGAVTPSRTITIADARTPMDVFLDRSHDVLFVTDGSARTVWVIKDASSANAAVVALPLRWMGVQAPFGIFVHRTS